MSTNQSLKKLTPDATLSQILSADEQAGVLLSSIGLDPSEHKDETLRAVCQQRKWSEAEVLKWIKKHRISGDGHDGEADKKKDPDFGNNLSKWCDYLQKEFNETNLVLLEEVDSDFPRVQRIHGNQYLWLKDMQWYFDEFDEALRLYYEFEQKKFYPLVRQLQTQNGVVLDGTVQTLERGMKIIVNDQQRLQRYMDTIRKKGNDLKNPEGACSTLRIVNQNFKTLFENLNNQFEVERDKILPVIKQKIQASQ